MTRITIMDDTYASGDVPAGYLDYIKDIRSKEGSGVKLKCLESLFLAFDLGDVK